MNLKLNFQISTPINLDMAGQIISLVDIKPHFMTKDFKLSISALLEVDEIWKYDDINFHLSNENLKKGNCSLDFNADTAVFTIDAVFTLKPKSKYTSLVNNPDTKWAFSGISISTELSSSLHALHFDSDLCEVVTGGSIEDFSYEQRWISANGEEGGRTNHIRYQLLNTEVIDVNGIGDVSDDSDDGVFFEN
jgi:hypothetical protein